jgi:hypothetical protein
MTVKSEATRDRELFWHVWYITPGLNRDDAHRKFLSTKPHAYTFDKFKYDPKTGKVMTL